MYRQRQSNKYSASASQPFSLSRSKLELLFSCPKCFYLDRKLGLNRPSFPSFTLNNAVDTLLKKEFDRYRTQKKPHPIMPKQPSLIPFSHPDLPTWRDDYRRYRGACFVHAPTNFTVCGIIDDIWVDPATNTLYLVDYKATSTTKPISLNDPYKRAYGRQMEIYQFIFRHLGFTVASTGYFVFANARKDSDSFNRQLSFSLELIPYRGDTGWIEPLLKRAKQILSQPTPPEPHPDCEYCAYRRLVYAHDSSLASKPVQSQQHRLFT